MSEFSPLHKRRLCLSTISSGLVPLGKEELHYLHTVLRLKSGEPLEVFDGKGNFASAIVADIGKKQGFVEVETIQHCPPTRPRLTIAMATPKRDRADWTIEKLTELGVDCVQWIESTRSVRVAKATGERLARWKRIARAALSQSGGYFLPTIKAALAFEEFLTQSFDHRFMGGFQSKSLLQEIAHLDPNDSQCLLIGPEGGFTDLEIQKALSVGYSSRQLGRHTLRTETAAIVGASMLLGSTIAP